MDYISIKEAVEKWGVSERRIQQLCESNRIPGAIRFSKVWAIPKDADKPRDARTKSQLRKMLCDIDAPYMQRIMCLIETQSKVTVGNWAQTYAEEHILPIYEQVYPNDTRPHEALMSAKAYFAGKIKYRDMKNECFTSAREAADNPAAQAAARACHQAVAIAHTTRHALGVICYGSAAIIYNRIGTGETDETYERLAEIECAKMEAALRAIAVENEPNPATSNWHIFTAEGTLFRRG